MSVRSLIVLVFLFGFIFLSQTSDSKCYTKICIFYSYAHTYIHKYSLHVFLSTHKYLAHIFIKLTRYFIDLLVAGNTKVQNVKAKACHS